MPPPLTRPLLLAATGVVLAALLGPVVSATGPVGAAVAAAARPQKEPPPLSSGWVRTTSATGASTYDTGPVALSASSTPAQLSTSMTGSRSGVLVLLGDSSATPFQAGHTYPTSSTVSLTVDVAGESCTNGAGGVGEIAVDQLVRTNLNQVTAVAFRFVCVDHGTTITGAMAADVVPSTPHQGYYTYQSTGAITGFGNDHFLTYLGDLAATPLNRPIVGMAVTADGGGYWMVASDGGIFAFGDAVFHGSAGNIHLTRPIVGMAASADGGGYWLVASDGGIFAYGDAVFRGSMGGQPLNEPVVGMARAPSGGYWLVASDGGIFAFGGAVFHGSTGALRLNRPVVGMTATGDGSGYWFVASDGGIFAFGDAVFHGSTGALTLTRPVVGMEADAQGSGYWLVASDGGIFAFGAPFLGSIGGTGVTDVAGLAA